MHFKMLFKQPSPVSRWDPAFLFTLSDVSSKCPGGAVSLLFFKRPYLTCSNCKCFQAGSRSNVHKIDCMFILTNPTCYPLLSVVELLEKETLAKLLWFLRLFKGDCCELTAQDFFNNDSFVLRMSCCGWTRWIQSTSSKRCSNRISLNLCAVDSFDNYIRNKIAQAVSIYLYCITYDGNRPTWSRLDATNNKHDLTGFTHQKNLHLS